MDHPRLFEPGPGVLCPKCAYGDACGASHSAHACAPRWGDREYGGVHVLHPLHPDRDKYMESVRGPDFANVKAIATPVPVLPGYLPQLRLRRGLSGSLREPIYGIRAREVIRGRRVVTAAEIRSNLHLKRAQKVVLILFDRDELLEKIWDEADILLPDLADAGFDLVVCPSYSIYDPRPRLEHLYNFKRALEIFAACQQLLIPALPRAAWFIDFDVRRLARWLNLNEVVEWLAVDLQTQRLQADWARALAGLELLDQLTSKRLSYLINGPTSLSHCADIYGAVSPRRVSITNATLASPIEPAVGQLELPVRGWKAARYEFVRRCSLRRELLAAAAELAVGRKRVLAPEDFYVAA